MSVSREEFEANNAQVVGMFAKMMEKLDQMNDQISKKVSTPPSTPVTRERVNLSDVFTKESPSSAPSGPVEEEEEEEERLREAVRFQKDKKTEVSVPRRLSNIETNAQMVEIQMQRAGTVRYTSNIPSMQGVSLTSLEIRDILQWHQAIERLIAQHPGCPFPLSTTIAQHVVLRLMTDNDIETLAEFNAAPFSSLIAYIRHSIRPEDKLTFLKMLKHGVYFKSKQDFMLTERNFFDFFENLKMFDKEFTFVYNFLCDSLGEYDERPPLIMKPDVGVLFFYITKIPCNYGFAVWMDMEGDRKFDSLEKFSKKFMDIARVHRNWSENTRKMHNIVTFVPSRGSKQQVETSFKPDEKRKFLSQKRLSMVFSGKGDNVTEVNGREESYRDYGYYEEVKEDAPLDFSSDYHPSDDPDTDEGPSLGEQNGRRMEPSEANDVVGNESDSEELAFVQTSDKFGPRPAFSNRQRPHTPGIGPPLPRPMPVHGVCFEITKTGVCEALKRGHCNYDHSEAAINAYLKNLQENARKFIASGDGKLQVKATGRTA
jgi:hypothetical protein